MMISIGPGSRPLAVATILVTLASVGCIELPPPPDNGQSVVTNLVQTSAQSAAHYVLSPFFHMQDAVAGAFRQTAQISLEYHDLYNNNLPAPSGSPNFPDWPDSDIYQQVYDDYAVSWHNATTYPWVIFYVTHLSINYAAFCGGITAGVTKQPPAPNVPQPDPTRRWSFIYVTDVQARFQTSCSPPVNSAQLENLMTHVVAHELGHQRAGLTHNDPAHAAYHLGNVPANRVDVMSSNPTIEELTSYSQPVFDATGSESPGSDATCRGNLLTNRLVQ